MTSRGLAILCFCVLTGLLILSASLPVTTGFESPQLASDGSTNIYPWLVEALKTRRMVRSWPFLGLSLYLLLNTLFCSLQRLGSRDRFPATAPPDAVSRTLSSADASSLVRTLGDSGWQIQNRDDGSWTARRGRWGFYGSLFFHANLLVVLLGTLFQSLFGFTGSMVIAEGQTRLVSEETVQLDTSRPKVFFCLNSN